MAAAATARARRDARARRPGAGDLRAQAAATLEPLGELPTLAGFDFVLCGSSGGADLERRVVRAARAAGVRSAVWLDHWVNYPARFVLDGEAVLPDELWVCGRARGAASRARRVPGPPVRVMGNPYLEDVAAEIRALEAPHAGERVLYVTEPTSVAAERATGDPLGWGYEERAALRGYLDALAAAAPAAVRLRTPSGRAARTSTRRPRRVRGAAARAQPGTTLAEDCAWADTVVGCDTMAMVVALAAGRRVVSVDPARRATAHAAVRRDRASVRAIIRRDERARERSGASRRCGARTSATATSSATAPRPRAASRCGAGCTSATRSRACSRSAATSAATCTGCAARRAGARSTASTSTRRRCARSAPRCPTSTPSARRRARCRSATAPFDLTFTTGVLIHQPPDSLPIVMNEIVRCSRRYVLCGEYYAERARGGALPRRARRAVQARLGRAVPEPVPGAASCSTRRFESAQRGRHGWDDVTFWLFEKT